MVLTLPNCIEIASHIDHIAAINQPLHFFTFILLVLCLWFNETYSSGSLRRIKINWLWNILNKILFGYNFHSTVNAAKKTQIGYEKSGFTGELLDCSISITSSVEGEMVQTELNWNSRRKIDWSGLMKVNVELCQVTYSRHVRFNIFGQRIAPLVSNILTTDSRATLKKDNEDQDQDQDQGKADCPLRRRSFKARWGGSGSPHRSRRLAAQFRTFFFFLFFFFVFCPSKKDGKVLTELGEWTPLTNQLTGHFLVFYSVISRLEIRHLYCNHWRDPLTLKCVQTVPIPFSPFISLVRSELPTAGGYGAKDLGLFRRLLNK